MSKVAYSVPQRLRPFLAPVLVLLLLTIVYGLVSLRLAAWVGGEAITRSELLTRMHVVQFIYDRQFGQDSAYDAGFSQRFKRDILDQMAEELVLLPAAAGLATEAEMNEHAQSYVQWIKAGYFDNDETEWAGALAALKLQEADLLKHFANNLLLTRLYEREVANLAVDEAEVKAYFEQNKSRFDSPEMVKVSHIVVETKEQAEQVLAELAAGGDFAALAKSKSRDQETAAIGGSLRWFERGEMELAFESAAFALEPGQVSEAVQTNEGWHLIKMESKQPAKSNVYEDVASLVKPMALEAKKDDAWNQYRRTLRGKQLILLHVR